jgi:CheY-like chemotaxis protein
VIRILLVEDDLTVARMLERLIRRTVSQACEVVHRTTAQAAILCLRLCGEDQYALVVSDFNLEQGTGGDVLAFRDSMANPPPFIFLSSDERCRGRGVPVLQKPCEPSAIRGAVLAAIDPPKVVMEVACG